jgi:hypothetical protein
MSLLANAGAGFARKDIAPFRGSATTVYFSINPESRGAPAAVRFELGRIVQ